MRLVDFLNLRTIGGQITALVIASIVAIHLILTVIFLIDPDAGSARSEHRSRSRAVCRGRATARGCGAAPIARG